MAIELLPEKQSPSGPAIERPGAEPASRPRRSPPSRPWKWVAFGFGAVALVSVVVFLIARSLTPKETGPKLTHTVTRGDLIVTVTEQGVLESAENTEIKSKVRGQNTVIWVIESGSMVKKGDVLVRLDTLFIEEQIDERTKYAHWSRSAAERSEADVTRTELAVPEYEEGTSVTRMMELEKELAVAKSGLRTAKNKLAHTRIMAKSGYVSELEIEEKQFSVKQAELAVELKELEIDVLKRFEMAEQLQTLKGNFAATKATHRANAERAMADASRRDRALEEHEHCVVRAERDGLVIYPSAARWRNAPEIAEGIAVYKDQVLLLMPDLSRMQVKVGIHESVVDRVKEGFFARVTLPDKTIGGTVSSVASVTRPSGWWTGNEVKYDTLIDLPSIEGLRPGMSAEVEVLIARYEDVLQIPVAAVVSTDDSDFCWMKTPDGPKRRSIELGDSNDIFTVVEKGLKEGDEVVLNPMALREAQLTIQRNDQSESRDSEPKETRDESDSTRE